MSQLLIEKKWKWIEMDMCEKGNETDKKSMILSQYKVTDTTHYTLRMYLRSSFTGQIILNSPVL